MGVEYRQDERDDPVQAAQPSDEVGPLVAVEHGHQHVEAVEDGRSPGIVERPAETMGDQFGVGRRIGEVDPQAERVEDVTDGGFEVVAIVEGGDGHALQLTAGERRGAEPSELEVLVHANGGEQPSGDRVEEGLGQLEALLAGDEAGIGRARLLPERPSAGLGRDQWLESGDRLVDDGPMQSQPLASVELEQVPFAAGESGLGPTGDRQELAFEVGEGIADPLGDLHRSRGLLGHAVATPSRMTVYWRSGSDAGVRSVAGPRSGSPSSTTLPSGAYWMM